MKRHVLFFIALFVLLCLTPLVGGAVWTWIEWAEHRQLVQAYEERIRADWVETEAVFTSCTDRDPHNQMPYLRYRWEGEWEDEDGVTHAVWGGAPTCAPGQRLAILADPSNPAEYTRPPGAFAPTSLILCLIGLGFTFIAVKEWLKHRRRKEAP